MACWCETNDKEKTKSISDAEARIEDLTTKIEELLAEGCDSRLLLKFFVVRSYEIIVGEIGVENPYASCMISVRMLRQELTAASSRLNTEIKNLEKEVAKNQELPESMRRNLVFECCPSG